MSNDPTSLFDESVKINFPKLWEKVPSEYNKADFTTFECDDAGGILRMIVGPDGDVHISVDPHPRADEVGHFGGPSCRIRTYQGGGHSQRVRKAALLLMLAIIEDAQEIPMPKTHAV